MPSLSTLVPTSTISAGDWSDEAGGTTDLHSPIDETGTADTAYVRSGTGATADLIVGLTSLPGDFGTLDALQYEIRRSVGSVEGGSAGSGDDTHGIQLVLETSAGVAVTDTMTVFSAVGGSAPTTNGPSSFTGLTGGRPERLRIIRTFTQSMGNDGHRVWVDFVRLVNGTYTVGGTNFTRDATDPEGLTDATSQVVTGARSITEAEGLLDSAEAVAVMAREISDVLGLLDDADDVLTPGGGGGESHQRTISRVLVTASLD